MLNGRGLQRDGNTDGMRRLQTCRYDVMSRVCTSVQLCANSLQRTYNFAYVHNCVFRKLVVYYSMCMCLCGLECIVCVYIVCSACVGGVCEYLCV